MNRKEYKKFIKLTGLSDVGYYVVFLAFMPTNKDWQALYYETSSDTLCRLCDEGYIEYYEDTINGSPVPRHRLTDMGKALVAELGESLENDMQEVLNHFNYLRKTILLSTRDTGMTKVFKDHVSYWLRNGNTVEEFKWVMDYIFSHWGDDPNFSKFLRPATMFKKSGPQYFPEKLDQAKEWMETSHDNLTQQNADTYDTYLL